MKAALKSPNVASTPEQIKTALREHALTLGFDVVGIAPADAAPEARSRLEQFIAGGLHGDMDWLETTAERRGAPASLWPDVRNVIMLGVN